MAEFLAFFFPQVYDLIDWTREYQSLDKELQQITPNAEAGERVADKLFQVWRRDGEATYILIHIEVQSQEDSQFMERMYIYHYRSFDIHKQVISLAILGDERQNWRPNSYSYELGGCSVRFEFPTAKLLDYEGLWENDPENFNVFAALVVAHLKTKATTQNAEERERWKWNLVQSLYERGYNQEKIIRLFRLIDWMMTLPASIQQSFESKFKSYQEERKMPILSNIELRAMEAGRQEGTLRTARESVLEVLEVRFNEVPPALRTLINQIEDISRLKQLLISAISIDSLADFQQIMESNRPAN
nr:transposase [Ancylothrix sp. D3o]